MDGMKESDIRKRIQRNVFENGQEISQFPQNMLMELTNLCNDSCLFCANSKCTRTKRTIEPELAERIIKEAYGLGTRELGFYQTGEPLLDKNLERYISLAKKLGYEYVYITTNGALCTKERAKSIINAGIDSIKFSINATNSKDYLLIHGKNEYDRVLENLIYVDELRKKLQKKVSLYISFVETRYTTEGKEYFQNKYRQYVDDILFFDCRNVGGTMKNEIDDCLSVHSETGAHSEQEACFMVFNRLHITCEGYLTLCCVDYQNYLAVADLNTESLEEAWNNSYARELRRRHLEHNLKGTMCYNCLKNCNEMVMPLRRDLASEVVINEWDKTKEILTRIQNWESAK